MAKRDNHYEAAFEEFLRQRQIPYVAVDETKRALLGDASLKSLDFIVSTPLGNSWLVDVKGRRFPAGAQKQYWKNWSTRSSWNSCSNAWRSSGLISARSISKRSGTVAQASGGSSGLLPPIADDSDALVAGGGNRSGGSSSLKFTRTIFGFSVSSRKARVNFHYSSERAASRAYLPSSKVACRIFSAANSFSSSSR